ncbi:MAG: CotS family spore coat protein [Eubacteriales bacterium]|nr:CotS family spore coat protein [Eubacteriales bacterium]
MYDYGLSTLEQYGLTAKSSSRTRGALLCYTEKGLLILREFHGSEKKLQKQQELLLTIQESGLNVDSFLENQEGSLVSRDKDEIPFTLQHWYDGRECDTKSRDDILKSVRSLAELHKVMKLPVINDYVEKSLQEEYVRHNQEIRKIRKFIRKKGPTSLFEKDFLASVEWFLKKGEEALAMLEDSSYETLRQQSMDEGRICHGEYNQHNVLIMKGSTAVTNFGHWGFDIQAADLYRFMRKVLEKYNWDLSLAREMLRVYHQVRPISPLEWKNLRVRFTYPEKYWKLANYYYSHNKAWISEKNIEKLKILVKQKDIWEEFAGKCFERYPF